MTQLWGTSKFIDYLRNPHQNYWNKNAAGPYCGALLRGNTAGPYYETLLWSNNAGPYCAEILRGNTARFYPVCNRWQIVLTTEHRSAYNEQKKYDKLYDTLFQPIVTSVSNAHT